MMPAPVRSFNVVWAILCHSVTQTSSDEKQIAEKNVFLPSSVMKQQKFFHDESHSMLIRFSIGCDNDTSKRINPNIS
jgi:hypothetical protein